MNMDSAGKSLPPPSLSSIASARAEPHMHAPSETHTPYNQHASSATLISSTGAKIATDWSRKERVNIVVNDTDFEPFHAESDFTRKCLSQEDPSFCVPSPIAAEVAGCRRHTVTRYFQTGAAAQLSRASAPLHAVGSKIHHQTGEELTMPSARWADTLAFRVC